jgi:hypothetical protein
VEGVEVKIRYFGFIASLAIFCASQVHAATIYEFDTPVFGSVVPNGTVTVTVTGSTATFVVSLPANDSFTEFALDLQSGDTLNASSAYKTGGPVSFSNFGPFNTLLFGNFGSSLTFSVSNFVGISSLTVNGQPIWFVAGNAGSPSWAIAADTIATPLPATLPLFASGLGVLGLLGWRTKRKKAAASLPRN